MGLTDMEIKTIEDKLAGRGEYAQHIDFSKSEINKARGFLKKAISYKVAKDSANYSAYFTKFEYTLRENKSSVQQRQIHRRIIEPTHNFIREWILDQMLEEKFKSADILYTTILVDIRALSKKVN